MTENDVLLMKEAADKLEKYSEVIENHVDPIIGFHSIRIGYKYDGPVLYKQETIDLVKKLREACSS